MDIAEMNLICAQGLPGSEHIDIPASLVTLDDWAALVQRVIEQNYHRFRDNPAEYNHSEGLYKMVMLVLTLQQDIGVKYDPAMMGIFADLSKKPTKEAIEADLADDTFYRDSKDVFLSGIIGDAHMGTCASMPVVYIAVGRRLGFPLKLATTKAHCFVRWDGNGERFNIEGTGGVNTLSDDYYKTWPRPMSQEEIDSSQYLKSLSPTEELAIFLENRAACLESNSRYAEALVSRAQANRLNPKSYNSQIGLAKAAEIVTAAIDPKQSQSADLDPANTTALTDPEEIMRLNRENANRLHPRLPGMQDKFSGQQQSRNSPFRPSPRTP